MRLLVDAQCLQSPDSGARGIGRYARNLLNAVSAARPHWQIEAVENTQLPRIAPGLLDDGISLSAFEPLLPLGPAAREANDRFFGEWLCARGADAILELNFFEEHTVVPWLPSARPIVAGVAYDLIPVLFHEQYLAGAQKLTWYAERLRQFAAVDVALAISETTRSDVLRLMRWPAEKVTTIGGAPEPAVIVQSAEEQRRLLQRLGIDRPFILCVGGVDARKNLRGTFAGFAALPAQLRATHQLVIVCALSALQRTELEEHARSLGIAGSVRLTGFVEDEALHALYERCRASVFLSFYEGLGLPVLEALRAGAPVVASNRSSIPEFSDPSTILIDPSSTGDVVTAIAQALERPREDGAEARRRFAAQFTWPRTATAAIDAIEAASAPVVRSNTRYRIAWVSPLPPTRSGIGDYSRELLEHLPGEAFEIELVVSAQAVVERALASRYRVIHEHEVDARHAAAPFDLFVYHVGNSDLHVYVLDLMRRYSGLVVLHEVFLGGLALNASAVGHWPAGVATSIECEGNMALAAEARRGELDHGRIVEAVTMNRPLLVYATAVLVHNAWSWTRVRAATDVPVFHVQQGIPEGPGMTREESRQLLGLPPDAFLVSTLGEVRSSKHVDRIIEAIATLPDGIRADAQLLVVGDGPDDIVTSLRDLAARLGLGEQVRFLGRVPLDVLGTYGCAADACVQLRHPVRGETSAALLRALAAGSACIVSDAGSLSEVGRQAALFIPTDDREVLALREALVQIHDDPAVGARLRHEARAWIRTHHRLTDAAGGYAAAMSLAIARRRQQHSEWQDTAARALAAAGDIAISDDVTRRWADVHAALRRTASS